VVHYTCNTGYTILVTVLSILLQEVLKFTLKEIAQPLHIN
jgi:hypothetical protein